MLYTIINILLYSILALIYWFKQKRVDVFLIIVLLYDFTAIMCAVNYGSTPYKWSDLGLIPFLFLFAILYIFFTPLKGFEVSRKRIIVNNNKFLAYLAYFYILCAFIDIYNSLPDTIARIQSGEWSILRQEIYNDASSITLYGNQWEKLIKNIRSYLTPFAIPFAFYQLTKPKLSKFLTGALLISIIVPSFISATVVASRGMVVNLVLTLGMTYLMFKAQIPNERNKYIYVLASFLIVGFLSYSLSVSISRFGEDEAGSSIFQYFGHSMLFFNDGIFNNVHSFAYGKIFFSWFIDLFGGNSFFDQQAAGATHGTAFYTMIGGLYLDFGLVGTTLVALISCIFMNHFFKKRILHLSDFVMIVFYVSTLAQGIFVFGSGRALAWIMTFIVYLIVSKLEKK